MLSQGRGLEFSSEESKWLRTRFQPLRKRLYVTFGKKTARVPQLKLNLEPGMALRINPVDGINELS